MPYYHATWRHNVPSILKHGLGGAEPPFRNFEEAKPGVYLTDEPAIAVMMLIEAYLLHGERLGMTPPEALKEIQVIVIDDSRVQSDLIDVDPNVEKSDCTWSYRGVIDVSCMPILPAETIIPKDFK